MERQVPYARKRLFKVGQSHDLPDLRQQCRELGESVGDFADKLLKWTHTMGEAQASLQTAAYE